MNLYSDVKYVSKNRTNTKILRDTMAEPHYMTTEAVANEHGKQ
jgi:hypothetical protein